MTQEIKRGVTSKENNIHILLFLLQLTCGAGSLGQNHLTWLASKPTQLLNFNINMYCKGGVTVTSGVIL